MENLCMQCSITRKVPPEADYWLENMPPGYTFNPDDDELIHHYLAPKNQGTKLPPNRIIEYDVYKTHPEELTERYEPNGYGPSWYFFSKHSGGSRPDTTVYIAGKKPEGEVSDGDFIGFWKSNRSLFIWVRSIKGIKLSLKFFDGLQKTHGKWFMTEYCLHPMNPEDTVLCKIYKDAGGSKSRNKSEPDTDSWTLIQDEARTCMSTTESEEVDQPMEHKRLDSYPRVEYMKIRPSSRRYKNFCSVCYGTGVWHSWMKYMPPGYTFKPSDEDLVYHYLYPKNQATKLPPNRIIEYDVYKTHPRELTEIYRPYNDGLSWYFFSKHSGGSRPDTIAYVAETNSEGEIENEDVIGFWKSIRSSFIEVKETTENSSIKGIKLDLEFVEEPQQTHAYWFMTEYSLHPTNPGDTVLCKIYHRGSKGYDVSSDSSSEGKAAYLKDSSTLIQDGSQTCMSTTESEEVDQPLI